MFGLLDLRLIPFFEFYLALVFVLGTLFRIQQYRSIVGLVRRFPGRWPRLLELVRQHTGLFLTWGTVLPLLLSLGLLLINSIATHWLWPQANSFTLRELFRLWPAVPVVLVCGVATVAYDLYGYWTAGDISIPETERYFDQAEYWLRSRTATVVRIFTLGYVNPREMVAVEVRSALVGASQVLNQTLWWMVTQTGLRIAFGLSLWFTYAFSPWLSRVLYG